MKELEARQPRGLKGDYKKRRFLWSGLVFGLILMIGLGVWQWRWVAKTTLSQVSPVDSLRSADGRVNTLLLGIGGEDHLAGDLTDTMMLISARLDGKDLVVISLPRDLWVPAIRAKLNAVYYYQKAEDDVEKLRQTKAVFGEILGVPIHYAVMVDFRGFVELVDLVGGVEVEVEKSFDDYLFPIPGLENALPESVRYEHLHFDEGVELMDGVRALKYVRSRNAQGDEGTDFARSRRQQRLLAALKSRLVAVETLFSPRRVGEMAEIYGDYALTDIKNEEYLAFVQLFLEINGQPLRMEGLDEGTKEEPGCLKHVSDQPEHDYQWVLVSRAGGLTELHSCLEQLLVGYSS